jgi:DNA modification methylase
VTSINSLLSDHKNARRRTDRSAELIKESLQRYGAARSIVIDEDNRILAGNGTIEGAKAAGIKNVRIIETDGTEVIAIKRSGLSEDEKVGLALADNRTADLSEWDQAMLHSLSQEHDLSPWFEQEDLNELLAVTELEPEEGNTDPDDVPEPPTDPITKHGDLWILGNHRLLCGDSTDVLAVERLMDGQKADMVYCDPPYGMNLNTDYSQIKGSAKSPNAKGYKWKEVIGDNKDFDPSALITLFQDVPEQFWWGADYYFECLPRGGSLLVWQKRDKADAEMIGNDFEICWSKQRHKKATFWKRWVGFDSVERGEKRVHPTQKPIDLHVWVFEQWGKPSDCVVDLFGGSGSTLIACEKTSRHCRMMELDPAYVDVIVKRWEDFTGNTAVCHPSDTHFNQEQEELF